ncbi:MAG: MOFRL family protein, partial [Balneolaceae bacterium]|nr:MOFRL family protein [Balneolaceae bacterium]
DLILSDVPDDDPATIGSGPTTPDPSTFQDAYHILLEKDLWESLPPSVRSHVEKGIDGLVPDTLKPGDRPVTEHHSFIIGSARKMAGTVAASFEKEGYSTWLPDRAYNEDVESVADIIAEKAIGVIKQGQPVVPPAALIFYGESTVQVTGGGKGGRNQELALRGAVKIAGYENITWLSAGTDGIDGPTDAAGAIVDGNTIEQAEGRDLDYRSFLDQNDSYHFHQKAGTLYKTGPTGNNLMDLQVVIVDRSE